MNKKLAKIKFLPNNYQIIEDVHHVISNVDEKKIHLKNLT